MLREIVLDTETTGLDHRTGDRIIEIAAVELINHFPTAAAYHTYVNPEREVPESAFAVHGIASNFLLDKPKFAEVAKGFIDFVGDATLIIHNASFDIGFLNFELGRLGLPGFTMDRVVDTLMLARRKNPGSPSSLDALCKRYQIDTSGREKHGALIDCKLLAAVYLELIGGQQATLDLASAPVAGEPIRVGHRHPRPAMARPTPLPPRLTAEEIAAHAAFIAGLKEPLWARTAGWEQPQAAA